MLTSIVGTNWGDEGKGRMVDLLSENYDIVVRYQGKIMRVIPLSMKKENLS